MPSKKGLGRSFESLIPTDLLDESFDPSAGDDHKVSDLRTIKLSQIVPDPEQPRRHFDQGGLDELTVSIQAHGILQPIVVVPKDGGYQIVAGERRYRASLAAGKESIPALVRTLSDQHRLELSLIENIQRRDLNPLETATAYAKLRDQFNMTLEEIGARVGGKSVSAVSNTLRLLKLDDEVKHAVADGRLSEGQARPLIGANPEIIKDLLPQIIAESWSARKIEQFMTEAKPNKAQNRPKSAPVSPQPIESLSKRFGTKVSVQETKKGAGKIVIEFKNAEERRTLEARLGG